MICVAPFWQLKFFPEDSFFGCRKADEELKSIDSGAMNRFTCGEEAF